MPKGRLPDYSPEKRNWDRRDLNSDNDLPKVAKELRLLEYLPTSGVCHTYKISMRTGLGRFCGKGIYTSEHELLQDIKKKRALIAKYSITARALRLIIHKLLEEGLISNTCATRTKRYIKVKRFRPDSFVPTKQEVRDTLGRLTPKRRAVYEFLIYSELRITELKYILRHYSSLKPRLRESSGSALQSP